MEQSCCMEHMAIYGTCSYTDTTPMHSHGSSNGLPFLYPSFWQLIWIDRYEVTSRLYMDAQKSNPVCGCDRQVRHLPNRWATPNVHNIYIHCSVGSQKPDSGTIHMRPCDFQRKRHVASGIPTVLQFTDSFYEYSSFLGLCHMNQPFLKTPRRSNFWLFRNPKSSGISSGI